MMQGRAWPWCLLAVCCLLTRPSEAFHSGARPFRSLVQPRFAVENGKGAEDVIAATTTTTTEEKKEPFAVQLNEFFKEPVPSPIKEAFSVYKETEETKLDLDDFITILSAAPGTPGVPRPLWAVIVASLPTGLLWYGFYKFAVEEELLQTELEQGKEPRGFGGYGTLGPFTYGMLLGLVAEILHLPGGLNWSALGIIFIYYTQFLLYDRVNQLYLEEAKEPQPLQVWWCLPIFFPFNLIVGLRQVHFLSQYFYRQRGYSQPPSDPVAEFFPFIQAPPFTWQQLLLTPSLWCKLLQDTQPIDAKTLPEPIQQFLALGTNSTESSADDKSITEETLIKETTTTQPIP